MIDTKIASLRILEWLAGRVMYGAQARAELEERRHNGEVECERCEGWGFLLSWKHTCPDCKGRGTIQKKEAAPC